MTHSSINVLIVGGGMITNDLILPAVYQLQRMGIVNQVGVSALNGGPLKALAESQSITAAFPESVFTPYPDYKKHGTEKCFPDLFKEALSSLPPQSAVIVALPDQLHYGAVKEALARGHHVLCVKPLVLKHDQAVEIGNIAREKGLLVAVEYHKRFDDRSLIARAKYRAGQFGDFRLGQARLIEPYYYRHSNFQNWCTSENSDAFSYVGCHYIDLVHFITGLLPVAVSVYGIEEPWPNGKKGFLWTDGRVVWNNGACLNVQNGFGYPDTAPGGNSQGLMMFMNGGKDGGDLEHIDSFRGVKHGLAAGSAKVYNEVNPDFFQYVPASGGAMRPNGYGYRSIEQILHAIHRINSATAGCSSAEALDKRRELLFAIDQEGILATPKNSAYNELVMEAGRLSILNSGKEARIEYEPHPRVSLA